MRFEVFNFFPLFFENALPLKQRGSSHTLLCTYYPGEEEKLNYPNKRRKILIQESEVNGSASGTPTRVFCNHRSWHCLGKMEFPSCFVSIGYTITLLLTFKRGSNHNTVSNQKISDTTVSPAIRLKHISWL